MQRRVNAGMNTIVKKLLSDLEVFVYVSVGEWRAGGGGGRIMIGKVSKYPPQLDLKYSEVANCRSASHADDSILFLSP